MVRLLACLLLSFALGAAPTPAPPPAPAPAPGRLAFVPHAAYFSLASRQPALVDPEIFVGSSGTPAALGFEQIAHLAGLRSAEMADDPGAPALDANGRPLGFDLQHWFAANGVVQLDPPDPDRHSQRVTARFANLVARGRYSLFVIVVSGRTTSVLPLDVTGTANSFTASTEGTGGANVTTPAPLVRGNLLVLVYHADRTDHGVKPGNLGIDAFHQLVTTVP